MPRSANRIVRYRQCCIFGYRVGKMRLDREEDNRLGRFLPGRQRTLDVIV